MSEPAMTDDCHNDIDAVYAMTARAMACGLLTEVVTAYGEHRATGESAERAAVMALWDWDA